MKIINIFANLKNFKVFYKNYFSFIIVLIILAYVVLAATTLPIYPDEVAYKIFIERFFYSGGYKQSLTPYCSAGFLVKPPIVLLPASMFGSLLLLFGSDWWSYRIIPVICITLIVIVLVINSFYKINRIPLIPLLGLAITPCIYGLVILRPEIFILFGGLIFFLSTSWLADNKTTINRLLAITLILLFIYSFLTSIHPKSLYLLPLAFLSLTYAANSINNKFEKIIFLFIFYGLLLHITISSIEFHKIQFLTCNEVPKIQNGMSRQSLNPLMLLTDPSNFIKVIIEFFNFDLVTRSISQLTFKNNFDSNYLPSINDKNALIFLINFFNVFIIILLLICILFLSLIGWKFIPINKFFIFLALTFSYLTPYFLNINKNWYENSFLLGGIVIILSLYYPYLHKFNFIMRSELISKHLNNIFKTIIIILAICTVFIIGTIFIPKFNNGFSGPGISTSLNRNSLGSTVHHLITRHSLGEQRGFIIDDLTYDPLKKSKIVLPATYLSLVGELPHIVNQSILSQGVVYGITRCVTLTFVSPALQWLVIDKIVDYYSGEEICLFKLHP